MFMQRLAAAQTPGGERPRNPAGNEDMRCVKMAKGSADFVLSRRADRNACIQECADFRFRRFVRNAISQTRPDSPPILD